MKKYIEITNNKGSMIINDYYKNVSYVEKISGNLQTKTLQYDGTIILYPPRLPGKIPVLQCDNPNYKFYYPLETGGGVVDKESLEKDFFYVRNNNTKGTDVDYSAINFFLFGWFHEPIKLGIQVMNAKGEEIYNSSLKYLNIIDEITEDGEKKYDREIGAIICNLGDSKSSFSLRPGELSFPDRHSIKLQNTGEGTYVLVADLSYLD